MEGVSDPVKSPVHGGSRGAGPRRPTQADVARLAGVSTATVSHVLSGRADRSGRGNAETRATVEAAMEQLGYRPNWAGRALRRQRTGLIGALVSAPSNPWREGLIDMAQRELARQDLDLVVFPGAPDPEVLQRFVDLLDRRAVDACFTVHVEDDQLPSRFAECPVPVVAFAEEGFAGVPTARHGYGAAAAEAVGELQRRGVRRFVLLKESSPEGGTLDRDFADPARRRLEAVAGGQVTSELLEIDYGISADLSAMDWASLDAAGPTDPIVLMCSSDRLAIQVSAECARRRIDVGRTVGVVGRGDISDAASGPLPLSTLGTSGAEYGEVFAALADAARSGEKIADGWTFPWRFIERASTARLLRTDCGPASESETSPQRRR